MIIFEIFCFVFFLFWVNKFWLLLMIFGMLIGVFLIIGVMIFIVGVKV